MLIGCVRGVVREGGGECDMRGCVVIASDEKVLA